MIAAAASTGDFDAVSELSDFGRRFRDLTASYAVKELVQAQTPAPKSSLPAYPRYKIVGDRIEKTGWDKKNRTEFLHAVPYDRFEQVVRACLGIAKGSYRATPAEIIAKLEADGTPVPAYQIYISVNTLEQAGVLSKNGHAGFRVKDTAVTTAHGAWERVKRHLEL